MSVKNEKLRELATEELQRRLNDTREELRNLRFQHATGELTDHTRLRQVRRQAARLITLLAERGQLTESEGEA